MAVPHSCPAHAARSASAFWPATSSCSTVTAVCCSSLSLGPCCSTLCVRPGWLPRGARMRATSASRPPLPSSLRAAPCGAGGRAGGAGEVQQLAAGGSEVAGAAGWAS
jgi:hypothetical protein